MNNNFHDDVEVLETVLESIAENEWNTILNDDDSIQHRLRIETIDQEVNEILADNQRLDALVHQLSNDSDDSVNNDDVEALNEIMNGTVSSSIEISEKKN